MHLLASLEENTLRDGTAIATDRIIIWAQSIVRVALGMFGADSGYHLLIQGMLGFRIFWEELVQHITLCYRKSTFHIKII